MTLVKLNHNYLLGRSIDPEMERNIRELILNRNSIDNVYAVRSQWLGPSHFSFKAEVDFDGTYLAAQMHKSYENHFLTSPELKNDFYKFIYTNF